MLQDSENSEQLPLLQNDVNIIDIPNAHIDEIKKMLTLLREKKNSNKFQLGTTITTSVILLGLIAYFSKDKLEQDKTTLAEVILLVSIVIMAQLSFIFYLHYKNKQGIYSSLTDEELISVKALGRKIGLVVDDKTELKNLIYALEQRLPRSQRMSWTMRNSVFSHDDILPVYHALQASMQTPVKKMGKNSNN